MSVQTVPIIVLGGSDRKPAHLPEEGRDKHPLAGYKGMAIRIGGRPLVDAIIDHLAASKAFGPIYVAGPASVYGTRSHASLIPTNATFGMNIRNSLEAARQNHPGRPIAFITCDILPETDTLSELMEDYRSREPCDMWFPLVRAPENPAELGASRWKPRYRIVPTGGDAAVGILPGHLSVVDPEALRLKFLYQLFQLGYTTRNRPIGRRRSTMVRGVLLGLLYQDLQHVLSGRVPRLTWTILNAGIGAARALSSGTITQKRLEDDLRRIFVRYLHRRRYAERRIALPIVDKLSLAMDIDTREEAEQMGGEVSMRSA